jgi:ectoine hydroxylase-related dioxygenase (phytanoyl-CoA dioxygenase family)
MNELATNKIQIEQEGFTIIDEVFSNDEIENIIEKINQADYSSPAFRKTGDLFAIRQFLKEIPAIQSLIFNHRMHATIDSIFGAGYFVVKSIYFDKPEQSNWFVAWHQDLTISVDKKIAAAGFGPWTVKQNQFAVQPPLEILGHNFTIRIHLDDTDKYNGALKVVPRSHVKGIYRPETIDWSKETESICEVLKGGIMIMRPLLLHASNRTTNHNRRRVIHIEFSNSVLPHGLKWSEATVPTH